VLFTVGDARFWLFQNSPRTSTDALHPMCELTSNLYRYPSTPNIFIRVRGLGFEV
jgi:hypothetical protein